METKDPKYIFSLDQENNQDEENIEEGNYLKINTKNQFDIYIILKKVAKN